MAKLFFVIFTCLGLFSISNAQQPMTFPLSEEATDQLIQDGWQLIAPGVVRKEIEPGRIQTRIGPDGLDWYATELEDDLYRFEEGYKLEPTEAQLRSIRNKEARLGEVLTLLGDPEIKGQKRVCELPPNCSFSWQVLADAQPLNPGFFCIGRVDYNNCGLVGKSQIDIWRTPNGGGFKIGIALKKGEGTSLSELLTYSLPGELNCSVRVQSNLYIHNACIFVEEVKQTNECILPLDVTISGTSSVSIIRGCQTHTWTASATGGTENYQYSWYYNGVPVGTGSQYTRIYCVVPGVTINQVDQLQVVVNDGQSSDSATKFVQVNIHGCGTKIGCDD